MTYFATMPSPIGELTLCSNGEALTGLYFSTGSKARSADPAWRRDDACLAPAVAQLQEYFAANAARLILRWRHQRQSSNTRFECTARHSLRSDAQLQRHCLCHWQPQSGSSSRPANGNNPIAIIIPCHRVVGSNGALTGFGGGLPAKRWLLDLESRHTQFTLSN